MESFFESVYSMVRQIPPGFVATYGQIARLVGEPRKARHVGFALHANPTPWPQPGLAVDGCAGKADTAARPAADDLSPVPCHRVVFADGRLCEGFAFGGPDVQRSLLDAEGVAFLENGKVDMASCRWPAGL